MANFDIAHIETKLLEELKLESKPAKYCRYVDHIFVAASNVGQTSKSKTALTNSAVLTFAHELKNKKSLSFLDVRFLRRGSRSNASVHVKCTYEGECLIYHSICLERSKTGVAKDVR